MTARVRCRGQQEALCVRLTLPSVRPLVAFEYSGDECLGKGKPQSAQQLGRPTHLTFTIAGAEGGRKVTSLVWVAFWEQVLRGNRSHFQAALYSVVRFFFRSHSGARSVRGLFRARRHGVLGIAREFSSCAFVLVGPCQQYCAVSAFVLCVVYFYIRRSFSLPVS